MRESLQRQIEQFIKRFKQYYYRNSAHSLRGSLLQLLVSPALWLGVFALFVIAALIFIYYYQYYMNLIDERLQAGLVERTVDVYTLPLRLQTAQRLNIDQLANYLQKLSYSPAKGEPKRGSYQFLGDSLVIAPLEATASTVRVEFSDRHGFNTVDRIVDLSKGGERVSYELPGLLLGTFSNTERCRRHPIEFAQIPKPLINATLAIEDRRFFEHPGVDYRGILRALTVDFQRGEVVQGGSTITQQLIKIIFKMNQRTFHRKFEEAFLAFALERRLSKAEIFNLYANEVYLGQQGDIAIRGFAEAARYYFGKNIDNLSLGETAFLAGLIRGPSYYSPVHNPEHAVARRDEVLSAMLDQGTITQSEYEQARKLPLKVSPLNVVIPEAPYFFDYASTQLQGLLAQLPEYGHFRTTVTLDPQLQKAAEKAIAEHVDRLRRERKMDSNQLQAALVALDPQTGDLLALVGGRDYSDSGFNRATTAMRQPGSAFKPFVYTTAFSTGQFNPASLIKDEAQVFTYDNDREYEPQNYGGRFSGGEVTLRQAFAQSLNTVTVALAMQVGLEKIASLAERAGLPRPKAYPSMALGTFEATPLEIAAAYGAFANGGQYVSPRAIRAITTSDGKQLVTPAQTVRSVCSPPIAYLITNLMESVINEGTARGAGWLRNYSAIAGKTGTSSDGWFIGYTPRLLVAVWVGYDDNRDLKLTGGHSALPIWEDFMQNALELRPELRAPKFPRPAGVLEVRVDADTGLLATQYCTNIRTELVASGFEPMLCHHTEPAYKLPADDEDIDPDAEYGGTMRIAPEISPSSTRKRRVLANSDFTE